jgi:hypothetical protein
MSVTTHCGDCGQDKPVHEASRIECLFGSLREEMDMLDQRIQTLVTRIEPVMGPDHPTGTPCGNEAKDPEPFCDVAGYIAEGISRIRSMSARIEMARDRLQI